MPSESRTREVLRLTTGGESDALALQFLGGSLAGTERSYQNFPPAMIRKDVTASIGARGAAGNMPGPNCLFFWRQRTFINNLDLVLKPVDFLTDKGVKADGFEASPTPTRSASTPPQPA